jgi:DMSO/TMAO reductase YedYZ molybdopterin-dependent catalytic subunit
LALGLAVPGFAGTRQISGSPVITAQDFAQYPAILTALDDFFVRNHFDPPSIDPATWRLRAGERLFSLKELEAFPQRTVTSVVECAGNGVGVGAVGCAKWEGVPFGEILRAGGGKHAPFVQVTGADSGREPDASEMKYSRTLSLEDATLPGTILALKMQGEPLRPSHGAPARLLVAGRYGMDSVKWIESIQLLDQPGDSFYMTHRFRRVRGSTVGEPVGRIAVKSVIVKPEDGSALRGDITAGGYAWAGPDPIAGVEIRVDRIGWRPAQLLQIPQSLGWVPWRIPIGQLRPGVHIIEARAFTKSGQVQPEQRDPGREDSYELNHVQRVQFQWRPRAVSKTAP